MANLWRFDECARCQAPTWCISRADGRPQCRACEVERFFDGYLYPPLGYKLLPWQRDFLRTIYGTSESADSWRRYYWSAYLCVPKKQGKTFLVAGLPIYHLIVEAERDEIFSPLAVSAASTRDQANLVMKAALEMIQVNPGLRARLKPLPSTKRIQKRNGNGEYQVLSADGKTNDGCEPSLVIKDEFHRWGKQAHETLDSVLTKGMKVSRKEPLEIKITTAGSIYESKLWAEEHQKAKNVIAGRITIARYYASIYQADPERIKREPEYWKSKEARVLANPSHVENGGFIADEGLASEVEEAVGNPHKISEYIRLNLNVETLTTGAKAIDPHRWEACPHITRGLLGQRCYGGVDLASTTDLASFALWFPDDEGGGDLKTWSWLPEEKIAELSDKCKVDLASWVRDGWLIACPGSTIDQNAIQEKVRWAMSEFDVRQVGYDQHNAWKFASELKNEGVDMVPVTQDYAGLNEPAKVMFELIQRGALRHDHQPVETWAADCLRIKTFNDRIAPVKPERSAAMYRIDPMMATFNAGHCWQKCEAVGEVCNAYDNW